MKVLVVGFPKTGTTSMAEALRQLGYKVYDYEEHFLYLGDQWKKVFTEGAYAQEFYKMYKDVDAATDSPACLFWEEIMEAFPDVKLIVTKRRNDEVWWKSWAGYIDAVRKKSTTVKLLSLLSPSVRAFYAYTEYIKHVIFSGVPRKHFLAEFGGFSPTVSKMRYREHNASVVARAPKDKLLEFDLHDGWEPLCKFLGKKVPKTPFPRANVKGENVEQILTMEPMSSSIEAEVKRTVAAIVVVVAVSIFAAWSYL